MHHSCSFGQRLPSSASNLTIKDELIPLVDHYKNLGVVFSQKLTWSTNYSRIIFATYRNLHFVCHGLSVNNCVQTKNPFTYPSLGLSSPMFTCLEASFHQTLSSLRECREGGPLSIINSTSSHSISFPL